MDQAQCAQGFHEVQFARIKLVKVLVTGQHRRQLLGHGGAVAREQHPQVLDRRPHARIVEVDKMRSIAGP